MSGVANPCSSVTSRWIKQEDTGTCVTALDSVSEAAFADALDPYGNKLVIPEGTLGNSRLREIDTSTSSFCSASATGGQLELADGSCWRHVHPEEENVYDFTQWALRHPGVSQVESKDTKFL